MKRAKLPKGIRKLRDGRFQIDVRDSQKQRHRPSFETLPEAKAEVDAILAKKAAGKFVATAATFGYLLDLYLADREGMVSAERYKTVKGMVGSIRPVFGDRLLSDFDREEMKFVQEWFDTSMLSLGYLRDLRRVFRRAFELGATKKIVGQPTPMQAFDIKVKRYRESADSDGEAEIDDKVLQLDEMVAVLRAAQQRVDREQYIVARMRWVLVLVGLLTAMRPQAYCALYWDCVMFDDRVIYLRRKCLNSGKVVWGSKTGRRGYNAIPMSPILHAVLSEWRDYLVGLGLPTTGAVPVLVTEGGRPVRVRSVNGGSVKRRAGHWGRIAYKAGLVNEKTEANLYTAYCLRHTAANMWRAIGVDLEDLRALMSHEKIETTSDNYLHEAPHLAVLRGEVAALGLERTKEGFVDALGIVLAKRWREAGLDVPCSPPRSMSLPQQAMLTDGREEEPWALPGKVIDGTASAVVDAPVIRTTADFKAWQVQEIRRLRAKGATKDQICQELRVAESTVNNVLRSADRLLDLKALPPSIRAGIRRRCREHYDSGQHKTIRAIAAAEGVRPSTVMQWAREDGWTPPKEHIPHKLGRHDALIRRRLAQGGGPTAIARELIALGTKVTGPAIADFARRHGLRDDPQTTKEDKKARVLRYLADGKAVRWIAEVEQMSTKTVSALNQQRKAGRGSPAETGADLARSAADWAGERQKSLL